MTSLSYQKWTEQLLNDHIKDKTLTCKVHKYTRASKTHGKTIVCPECNKVTTVFHFSWSALSHFLCNQTSHDFLQTTKRNV